MTGKSRLVEAPAERRCQWAASISRCSQYEDHPGAPGRRSSKPGRLPPLPV